MIPDELKKTYLLKKEQIRQEIRSIDISDELINGLESINEELCCYALKLNNNVINSKISFYYLFSDLRHDVQKKIINSIKKMFKLYGLSDGYSKYVDADDNNPYYELDNIKNIDFWEFDFTYCNDYKYIEDFIVNIKKTCRDLLKCIFIFCDENFINESGINIKNENRSYGDLKFKFDYIFKFENKDCIFSELEKNLVKNGFECNFNSDDILDVKDYRDNEIFIEEELIKNNILKDNNKLSFKDINCKCNFNKTIKLNDMVGLKNVKEQIKDLESLLKFYKDMNITNSSYLNVIFKGNPGTGKTTIARIYADLLYDLGYIKSNKLVEIVPSDLMGEYVGQTKETTRRILNRSKGGVLFIDEAYNLNMAKEYSGGSYMREAVVELLKYMEDKSNVIVFAGYKLEMEELLNLNPGFKSRIGSIITFDDYTTKELIDIFKLNAKKYGLKYSTDFLKKLEEKIKKDKLVKNFGNARYIETLLNKILIVHAKNVYKKGTDLRKLNSDDLELKEDNSSLFGFASFEE